jgi:hypothetical protein
MSKITPIEFMCPITHLIMNEPVIDNEGNSYEKEAISKWLLINNTSPITRNHLRLSDLKPNRALKDIISNFNKIKKVVPPKTKDNESFIENDNPIKLDIISSFKDDDVYINLTIEPINNNQPVPMDIVIVIDVSGSMQDPALVEIEGITKDVGFTLLDITKHAINTIIETMKKNVDRISIVTFSNNSEVIYEMNTITFENIDDIKNIVSNLYANGATNLWSGLNTGLSQFINNKSDVKSSRVLSMILMTDGIPSEHLSPPRGIINSLKNKLKLFESNIIPTIYTYGFGYNLDTKLLVDIASIGNGCFSFIPDSGFIGTVLVNSIANICTTVGRHSKLTIKSLNDKEIKVIGYPDDEEISLETIHYGQNKDLIIVADKSSILNINYSYINNRGELINLNIENYLCNINTTNNNLNEQLLRLKFVEMLNMIVNEKESNIYGYNAIISEFLTENNIESPIIEDIKDQVSIAISSKNYYDKWGKKYLYSLLSANKQQRCNNFKDKSIAMYGGDLFNKQRDIADAIFSDMSAPIPSKKIIDADGKAAMNPNTFRMNSYNMASNGCFHENSLVHLANYKKKKCSEIKKGDIVKSSDSIYGKVLCVVKNDCDNNITRMCCFDSGLMITSWHPICFDKDKWEFPINIIKDEEVECHCMYNFILDVNNTIMVNDIKCITLGHNINNTITNHPYYGSIAVINDLRKMKGYDKGLMHFKHNCIIRDKNNIVIGYDEKCLYDSI